MLVVAAIPLLGIKAAKIFPTLKHPAPPTIRRVVSPAIEMEGNYQRSSHVAEKILATIDQSPSAQDYRKLFIDKLQENGIIQKIDIRKNLPLGWVSEKFLSFDDNIKADFLGMVFAYYMVLDPMNQKLIILDNRTNNKVGQFTALAGLEMSR